MNEPKNETISIPFMGDLKGPAIIGSILQIICPDHGRVIAYFKDAHKNKKYCAKCGMETE